MNSPSAKETSNLLPPILALDRYCQRVISILRAKNPADFCPTKSTVSINPVQDDRTGFSLPDRGGSTFLTTRQWFDSQLFTEFFPLVFCDLKQRDFGIFENGFDLRCGKPGLFGGEFSAHACS